MQVIGIVRYDLVTSRKQNPKIPMNQNHLLNAKPKTFQEPLTMIKKVMKKLQRLGREIVRA